MGSPPVRGEVLAITTLKDGRLTLSKGGWSLTIPAGDLPNWIAFYKAMEKRLQGRYARYYTPDIAVMEAAQKSIKG